jgi:hypothetical protein
MGLDLLPRIFKEADLHDACYFTLYQIVDADRELPVFVPAQVEVASISTRKQFWPGIVEVRALVAAEKKKQQSKPANAIDLGLVPVVADPAAEDGGCGGDGGEDHTGGDPGCAEPIPGWQTELIKSLDFVDFLSSYIYSDTTIIYSKTSVAWGAPQQGNRFRQQWGRRLR